jgi:quercetin dioxygenase-like cupin family protein
LLDHEAEDHEMTDDIHAERREPEQPSGAFDLTEAARELLGRAGDLAAGRAARTLTPGAGAPLKQTLLAITAGGQLDEHPSPGPATIQVVLGDAVLRAGTEELELHERQWAVLPDAPHDLRAVTDLAVLLTVVNPS